MSYCRFENTLKDLKDCLHHLMEDDVSESEEEARIELIKTCVDIALDYGDEVDRGCMLCDDFEYCD